MDKVKRLGRWERRILLAFADRFGTSAHRRGGRRLRIGRWEALFPETGSDAGERTGFLEAMEWCADRGVISVTWKKYRHGDDVEAAHLVDDILLYELLGAEHPDDLLGRIVDAAASHEAISDASKDVLDCCRRIMAEKSVPPFGDPKDVADLMTLLDILESGEETLPLRALSVRLFNDSKRIESIKLTGAGLLRRIGREDILSRLERSFPECGIRGKVGIEFTDGRVWLLLDEAISLSLKSISGIERISDGEGRNRPFLSVENKETFHLINRPDLFCGYLFCSGHINEAVRAMILKIRASGLALYHFGDMDPDGIMIFEEINALCEGTCVPFMMDVKTYLRYLPFGYELDSSRVARLSNDAGPLSSLAEEIRKKGKGVEQEIVDTGVIR